MFLKYMGKPKHEVFEKFSAKYKKINEELSKEQFLVTLFNVIASRQHFKKTQLS